jgi:hypothetical protein
MENLTLADIEAQNKFVQTYQTAISVANILELSINVLAEIADEDIHNVINNTVLTPSVLANIVGQKLLETIRN